MTTTVKEKITTDFQKAKEEGGLRAERIREILKEAVSQAATEVKAGSGEIRTIAQDAIAAVLENVQGRGEETKTDLTASVECIVEGIKASKQEVISKAQAYVDQLQAQVNTQSQELDADIDGALVAIESTAQESTSDFKTLLASVVKLIRSSRQFAVLQEEYAKFKTQAETLDSKLDERYGDRYGQVKQTLEKYWEILKAWFDKAKTELAKGTPDPIQKAQVELGAKMAAQHAAAQQAQQSSQERVQDLLTKESECEVADAE